MIRVRGRGAFALCIMLAAVAVVIAGWPRPGTPGWTGIAVTVPSCPAAAEGCRVFVSRASNDVAAAHADWSGGAATTLNIALPAGRYSISAEGCTGDEIATRLISVTSGLHLALDMGTAWQIPTFVGRRCPGFLPAAPG